MDPPRDIGGGRLTRQSALGAGVSDERAEARDGTSEDQGVHLAGAFVGVDSFGIGDEAPDVVLHRIPLPSSSSRAYPTVSRMRTVDHAQASEVCLSSTRPTSSAAKAGSTTPRTR
ncbi:MAG: hypothetical protein QOE41_2678 [Mycobacterium sp.]|nr:hypothetical protein [Mycobacterium sp.]